jgi:LysR family glycine cleavage system transcriptional activator
MSDFPPIASLRSFEAVARLGSVTLAAKELHVTHSAISQQIKTLEEMVGVKLFIRQGRGVQINEEGRLYALQVREALNHIADATRLVQVKPRKQELTLAMVPSFGCHWLLPRLERFRAKYPLITLRIQASLTVTSLQQEGIDIAIRMGQGNWEGSESHYLFPMSLLWWPHRAITGACCPLRQLRLQKVILFFHGVVENVVRECGAGERDRAWRFMH